MLLWSITWKGRLPINMHLSCLAPTGEVQGTYRLLTKMWPMSGGWGVGGVTLMNTKFHMDLLVFHTFFIKY